MDHRDAVLCPSQCPPCRNSVQTLDFLEAPEALNCKIRVSFIQISNEKIYDLLVRSHLYSKNNSQPFFFFLAFLTEGYAGEARLLPLQESQSAEVCRIREGGGAVLLEGLTEVEVGSPQGVLQLYRRGAGNRQSGV